MINAEQNRICAELPVNQIADTKKKTKVMIGE